MATELEDVAHGNTGAPALGYVIRSRSAGARFVAGEEVGEFVFGPQPIVEVDAVAL